MKQTDARSPLLAETSWDGPRLDSLASGVFTGSDEIPDSITVTAPMTDEPIGSVPRLDEAAVEAAAAASRSASKKWRNRPLAERTALVNRFASLAENRREELIDLVQLETGKARRHAFEEAIDVPLAASYYSNVGERVLSPERRKPALPVAASARVQYEPYGLVGVITPWNNPLTLSTDVLPALIAGNGVLWKPDDKTPFVALYFAELLAEAGLPEDVLTIVTGDGETVGPALIDSVDYLTFTGGSDTGRIVAERAGRNLIDCSLELSGKNPMIVCADARLSNVVRGAIQGSFTNAGQVCLAMERILVEQALYEEFLDAFVSATEALELGIGFDYEPDVGPLINQAQLERTIEHVEDARERGATIHTGGNHRPDVGPYFFEPTILTDVPPEALPACEETFGPVVAVEPVASIESAIEMANDSDHGLNASVWSSDHARAMDIARQLQYGTVCINDAYAIGYATYDAPMGGFKDSGIGRRHGPEGVKKYAQSRTVARSRIGPATDPPIVPTNVAVRGWDLVSRIQRQLHRFVS